TGVLVLITSAAFAVTLAVWKKPLRWPFALVSFIFVYTTVLNIYERPEGIKIASFFIASMVATSLLSRALRSTELRVSRVEMDSQCRSLLDLDEDQVIRVIARAPRNETAEQLDVIDREVRDYHNIPLDERLYF